MPIHKAIETPNGVAVSFHAIDKITVNVASRSALISVKSWPSIDSYQSGAGCAWAWDGIALDAAELFPLASINAIDSLLVNDAEGPFAGGAASEQSLGIDMARIRKIAQVDKWHAKASEVFRHRGKQFASDVSHWKSIAGVHGLVTRGGVLPGWWPGRVKAIDGTSIDITTTAEWDSLYAAAVASNAVDLSRSMALKAYINDAARTVAEIDSVTWAMELPT